ncbi:unnamed protein product [Zymoseptoria tritici ST99CH_1E4]|uniref:Uncharacterized protein n=1 Tax=Zymoseptoria tritici ST99CH_1E4 TaxID=1276532 RepID=A0A2H1GGZ0_ZYMTR|nr:unnamed protein product [Zymoseptoria tritici ST99CH_1E4]
MALSQYDKAVMKGRALVRAMNAHPEDSTQPQSTWTFDNLPAHGWTQSNVRPFTISPTIERGMHELMNSRGLSLDDASNTYVEWDHDMAVQMERAEYDRSGGLFYQVFNLEGHTILADKRHSPEAMAPQGRLPPLRHWSDVTYLQWARLAHNNDALRRDLRRVASCNIVNKDVQGVIDRVLGRDTIETLEYPGRTFRPTDGEHFEALLGTSTLSGVGYMLAQHKAPDQLGWRTVESISVWCPEKQLPQYFAVVNIVSKA